MNSRERVMAALNHTEPDRVPIDIGGGLSTSIMVEGYEKLKQHLGISEEPRILNKIFRIGRLDESVMRYLGSDCRPLTIGSPSRWRPPSSSDGTFTDIWGIVWKQAYYGDGCYYWELAHNPLANATVEDLETYPWPDTTDPGFTEGLAEEAKNLYEQTDYAIMADSGFKSFWELAYMMRGLDRLLMDLVLDPEFVSALMSKLLEINIAVTSRFLDLVGPYIQVFRMGDDLATQQGLLISPKTYRALIKPVYKKYIDLVRSKTKAKIFFHSCGNVINLLEELIEIGVEIINPIQVSALCDTSVLKVRFGDRLVFWGGIDSQDVLPNGSAKDVEAEVRKRICDLAPGGGYVLASVHVIQPDVPAGNIIAMAEANRKLRNLSVDSLLVANYFFNIGFKIVMKALVLKEYKNLIYEEVPLPEMGCDDVLIEVKACGICGSDVHGIDGSTGRRQPPIIMGHEASGIIADTGNNVTGWKKSDRVTFDSTVYCGKCFFCRRGQINLCDNRMVLGVSCDDYCRHGAFAEYVVVPQHILYALPEKVTFNQAAMSEALSIAFHAVERTQMSLNDTAVVVGAGPIGLLLVQTLRVAGCGSIIAVDIDKNRLELACELGADVALKSDSCDVTQEVLKLTCDRGSDLAFEAVGVTPTVKIAVDSLRKGGSLILIGNLSPSVEMPLQSIVTREISVYGSCASCGEYPACLEMIASQAVNVERLISATAPLAEGASWFGKLYEHQASLMKVVLVP